MIVAHITEEMAFAVRDAVVSMITTDAAAVGITLPLAHTALLADYQRVMDGLKPTTKLWIETLGEFGFRLRLDRSGLFSRYS